MLPSSTAWIYLYPTPTVPRKKEIVSKTRNNWTLKIGPEFVQRSEGIAGVLLIAIAYRFLMQWSV